MNKEGNVMNSINLIGRATAQPVIKDINGKQLLKFTIAVDYRKGNQRLVDFFDCHKWFNNNVADAFVKIAKGQMIGINGTMPIDTYQKDGKTFKAPYVNVSEITFTSNVVNNNMNNHVTNNSNYDGLADLPI